MIAAHIWMIRRFVLPGNILDEGRDMIAKANTFMASKSRIDERGSFRMYTFKKEPDETSQKYLGRPLTAEEREKMMGYPPGYVSKTGESRRQFRLCLKGSGADLTSS